MEKSATNGILGCGSSQTSEITLNIQTTTGGNFFIVVDDKNSVEQLKKIVSKKLKVSKDRICLLHRERQLRDGTLKDNGLVDGSRVILLPSVETGLLTQRPENSVMQALESLNDSQVNDFLSGKSPLNLTMRLGDHMMLIQLQLSTLNPGNSSSGSGTKSSSSARARSLSTSCDSKERKNPRDSSRTPIGVHNKDAKGKSDTSHSSDDNNSSQSSTETEQVASKSDDLKSFLRKQDIETLQNAFKIFKSLAEMQDADTQPNEAEKVSDAKTDEDSVELCCEEQSPIKSLSNLVSSPLKSPHTSTTIDSDIDRPLYTSSVSSLQANEIENCDLEENLQVPMETVMSESISLSTPQYVPLPSSLKNNLIESLVEGSTMKSDSGSDSMCTDPVITDPIAANLTSCLCSTFNDMDYSCSTSCHSSPTIKDESVPCDAGASSSNTDPNKGTSNSEQLDKRDNLLSNIEAISESIECDKQNLVKPEPSTTSNKELNKNKRLHYLLHKTSKLVNPIAQSKHKVFMQSVVNKQLKKKVHISSESKKELQFISKKLNVQAKDKLSLESEPSDSLVSTSASDETSIFKVPKPSSSNKSRQTHNPPSNSVSDTKALIEASKNLTQTLKKLSKEVLTNKVDLSNEDTTRAKIGQGAVIESMKHHGKGIYSGTFSGTLNPALQDRFGRPKRDISTIIHILNDLLCATPPQYRRGARITFEPTHNTNSSKNKQCDTNKHQSDTTCNEEQEESECGCSKCNDSTCPYGECNGHPPQQDPEKSCSCQEVCHCSRTSTSTENPTLRKKCMACSDREMGEKSKRSSNKNCKKCNLASALALENSKTKCKLDQLRLVMQQKKQKREERKMKAAPYIATSSSVKALQTENTNSVLAEEIDTLA